ncbi:lipopolysaccharide biosynthesis protein [Aerococcus sp. NPDC058936]|uniref:lipopolysaccharide biosynthesis protein n=1 Tax=Aerococcus sp. NPDC058936 TaxID=3346674 RepID=UPI0036723E12
MDRYKKLLSNSFIFTIANFGSKIITFLMVPLYTNYLNPNQYGSVDLITTTVSLLVPLLSMEIGQAIIRYSIENTDFRNRKKIFNNMILFSLGLLLFIVFAVISLKVLNVKINYSFYFSLLLYNSILNSLFSQFVRGIGRVKQFAFNGVITTFVTVILNIIFLVFGGLEVAGYLLSMILSLVISNIYLLISAKEFINVNNLKGSKAQLKEMIHFSIPLIPNSSMWWLINSSTRYFILYFVGTEGNGLFAVANKIPSIISLINTIFSQAWQISSFEEYNSNDREKFYGKIFEIYSSILFIASSLLLIFIKPIMDIFVAENYYESWMIIPPLLVGVIYQSLSTFLGMNYTASKQTKGAFTTSVYGAIFSVFSSLIFIPIFGTIGAGVSTAFGFGAMLILRLFDTRKIVKIDINIQRFVFNNVLIIIQGFSLFYLESMYVYIVQTLIFLCIVVINRRLLINIVKYSTSFLR